MSKIISVPQSVIDWHLSERETLKAKLETAEKKPPEIESKIDDWDSFSEVQKYKKCLSKTKSAFNKPHKALSKLIEIGDDLVLAVEEGLRPHRLQRIVDVYSKQLLKLNGALNTAQSMAESLPEITEVLGGFEWPHDVPEIKDGEGRLVILTSEGSIVDPINSAR